ncbi:MAG: DUF4185 domain-containing protein [Armatimonadota bacterium]|nr:DUF4185 domain-containing protein [bacterium]MDW8320470.1 DUF4185 domain-containing protein [Armatimonadota bacterium]
MPLEKERILWLFGDTYFGEVRNGRRVNARLVMGNSVAIQHGKNAQSARLQFFFGKHEGVYPTAFIRPRTSRGWFWFGHGLAEGKRLWLFLTHIVPEGEPGVFGFRSQGAWLAEVLDHSIPPLQWRYHLHQLPFYRRDSRLHVSFGSAVWSDRRWMYVYGTHDDRSHTPLRRGLVAARVPMGRMPHFTAWQFWTPDGWSRRWRECSVTGDDVGAEFSVCFVPAVRKWVMVYSPADLSPEIRLRWADSPVGVWSEPQTVYRCPDVQTGRHVFCYAAKAHPELSAPDELLVTYATNSFETSEVLNNAELYVPRFVRLRFSS